jgi:hypothetical protein
MLMGWLMPALVFGAGLYIKSKAAAGKFRWLVMTEKDAKKLPVIAAVHKAESGDALPQAPSGFRWKPITLMYAASPFSAPSEIEVHVLERWLNDAHMPEGGTGSMHDDADNYSGSTGSFITAEDLQAAPAPLYMGGLADEGDDGMEGFFGDPALDGLSDDQLERLADEFDREGNPGMGYYVRRKLKGRKKRRRSRRGAPAAVPPATTPTRWNVTWIVPAWKSPTGRAGHMSKDFASQPEAVVWAAQKEREGMSAVKVYAPSVMPETPAPSVPLVGDLGRHRRGGGFRHRGWGGRGWGGGWGPGWGWGPPPFVVYEEPVILTERETFDLGKEQKKAKEEEEKEKKRLAGFGDAGASALQKAIAETAGLLRARGLQMVRIDPGQARPGDFVVIRAGCKLGQLRAGPVGGLVEVDVVHPGRGRVPFHPSAVACAFGVRSA